MPSIIQFTDGRWISCNFGQHDVDWSVTVKLSDVRSKKI